MSENVEAAPLRYEAFKDGAGWYIVGLRPGDDPDRVPICATFSECHPDSEGAARAHVAALNSAVLPEEVR